MSDHERALANPNPEAVLIAIGVARVNNNFEQLHPLAKEAVAELGLTVPCFNPFMNTIAQIVESAHCVEDSIGLIGTVLDRGIQPETVEINPRAGRGVGAIEAPRGILFHDYEYDDTGKCVSANLVIPTAQNLANLDADMRQPEERLGRQEVDGRSATGFRVRYVVRSRDGLDWPHDWTIWVDSQTGLPIRIELVREKAGNRRDVYGDFQFNADLEESLFSLSPPDGYQVVKETSGPRMPTEEHLIEGLRAATVLADGRFPSEFNRQWLVKWSKECLQPNLNRYSEEELDQLQHVEKKMRNGFRFLQKLETRGDQWSYVGGGVKLGDFERPLCWRTSSEGNICRIVYGDLSVRDALPEELPISAEQQEQD